MTESYDKKTKISLYGTAAIALGLGYADLTRGGITISAMLLALAYCVLIPLAIWHTGPRVAGDRDGPPYRAAAIAATSVFALYLVTMAPSTAMWDTSEYIAAAYSFGLPHPPGNPFFVIIGRVFSILPIARSIAARVNVLAALCSAAAAGLWFLVAEHALRGWVGARWQRQVGGALAALIGSTAFTVWNQSVVNEKVYTVSLAGIALVSWLAVRWSARPDRPDAARLLVMIAYLCGLGYANHMAGMLPAPALALAVIVRRPTTVFRWKLLLACLTALVVGMTPFATQPIRAAYFPALNEGEPTACRTRLELRCTFSKATLDAFSYNFNRGQYGKPALGERQASFGEQLGMWWLYFRWQWLRDASSSWPFAQALLAATFLLLGVGGGWVHYRRDRDSFWYFGSLMFTMTLALIYYLNFKLGASQAPASPAPHEVRDRDYFFLWSFSAWSVWAAIGLMELWRNVAELAGTRERRTGREVTIEPLPRSWAAASPMLLLALVPLFGNWSVASRSRHRATRDIAADILNSVEPYGVLVTVGDNDTFPLWYAQEVEGIRRDVVVVNTSLLGTDWYGRQIVRRPIYDYDAAKGPALYRGTRWTKPTTSPLHMTLADVDAVPEYYPLPTPMEFSTRDLHAVIDPKNLEYGVLLRADALVLRIIQDSWPDRPVYFARSAGGYPRALGLENNVLAQGLASKLFIPPARATRDTAYFHGDGWLDVPRSAALWSDVFTGHTAVIHEGSWVDRPSASMPALYLFAGAELGEALSRAGKVAAANKVLATTRDVGRVTGFDALVRGLEAQAQLPPSGDSAGVSLRGGPVAQPLVQSTEPVVRRPAKP